MLIHQSLDVLPGESGVRLDRFLRDRFPGIPSRSVRFAIEGRTVRVGGAVSPKGRILREGEIVTVASLAEGNRTGSPSLPIFPGRPSSTTTPTSSSCASRTTPTPSPSGPWKQGRLPAI